MAICAQIQHIFIKRDVVFEGPPELLRQNNAKASALIHRC
jgi:hypothetical protein